MDLQLPLSIIKGNDEYDIDDLLHDFVAEEDLEGWICPKCKKKHAKAQSLISKFPDVLSVGLSFTFQ